VLIEVKTIFVCTLKLAESAHCPYKVLVSSISLEWTITLCSLSNYSSTEQVCLQT